MGIISQNLKFHNVGGIWGVWLFINMSVFLSITKYKGKNSICNLIGHNAIKSLYYGLSMAKQSLSYCLFGLLMPLIEHYGNI